MENYREILDRLCMEMIDHDRRDPKRIQHFMKVHAFAALIARREELDEHLTFIIEAASYMHDIGIHKAEALYGRCTGALQEELGPGEAEPILRRLGFDVEDIERICYLIGHHHTYTNIQGMDYRILIEADFLVNMYEESYKSNAVQNVYEKIFVTETGRKICRELFLDERNQEYKEWIRAKHGEIL